MKWSTLSTFDFVMLLQVPYLLRHIKEQQNYINEQDEEVYYNCLVKFYLSRIRKQHRLKDPSWDLRINIGEDENQNEDRLHSSVY